MKSILNYKGYVGDINYSQTDNILYGHIQGIRPIISYEGHDIDELIIDFHEAIDEYLDVGKEDSVTDFLERKYSMKDMLNYKGYSGCIKFSVEDNVFYGTVQNINAIISYEGYSVDELVKDFKGAVDAYLEFCKKDGEEPEKPKKYYNEMSSDI